MDTRMAFNLFHFWYYIIEMKIDKWGLDLLSRLLAFRPSDRLPLTEALEHAYFRGAYISEIDGSEHPTAAELYLHDLAVAQHMHSSSKSSPLNNIQPLTPVTSSSVTMKRKTDCTLAMIPYDNKALASVEEQIVSLWFECASSSSIGSSSSPVQTLATDSLMLDVYDPSVANSSTSDPRSHSRDDASWSLSSHVGHEKEPMLTCDMVFLDLPTATGSVSSTSDPTEDLEHSASSHNKHSDLQVHFQCPKCGREFDAYDACVHHARVRKHSQRCHTYYTVVTPPLNSSSMDNNKEDKDESSIHPTASETKYKLAVNETEATTSFPSVLQCLSTEIHTLLQPVDPDSGWCDLLGRRRVMEDRHSMSHEVEYSYYAVHDGHFGSRTARIMARNHHSVFRNQLLQSLPSVHHTRHNINTKPAAMDNKEADTLFQFNFSTMKQKTQHILYTANPNTHTPTPSSSNSNSNDHWNHDVLDNMMGAELSEDDVIYNHTQAQTYASPDTTNGFQEMMTMVWTVKSVVSALHYSYLAIDDHLISMDQHTATQTDTTRKHESMDITTAAAGDSGTTTAAVLVFPHHLVISNLGDSRVVLCCDPAGRGLPVQLTLDHTPHVLEERNRVLNQGGFITNDVHSSVSTSTAGATVTKKPGTIPRVNGVLAVTRSIGDLRLKPWVTAEPDILILRRDTSLNHISSSSSSSSITPFNACQQYQHLVATASTAASAPRHQLFLIIASDGLWDAVSNQDAVDIVCEHLLSRLLTAQTDFSSYDKSTDIDRDTDTQMDEKKEKSARKQRQQQSVSETQQSVYQEVTELLSREAYLRGSSDNIGTCVVNLLK